MKLAATWTGTDREMGLRRGQRYTLTVDEHNPALRHPDGMIALMIVSPVRRPYSSCTSFFREWQSVSKLSDP